MSATPFFLWDNSLLTQTHIEHLLPPVGKNLFIPTITFKTVPFPIFPVRRDYTDFVVNLGETSKGFRRRGNLKD